MKNRKTQRVGGNRKITSYGLIRGGSTERAHARRKSMEDAALKTLYWAEGEGAIKRDGDKVTIVKSWDLDFRKVILHFPGDKQLAYYRVKQEVIEKRIGKTITWKHLRRLAIQCSEYYDGARPQDRVYRKRKKDGDL